MSAPAKRGRNFALPLRGGSFTALPANTQQPCLNALKFNLAPPPDPAKPPFRLRTPSSLPVLTSSLKSKPESASIPHPLHLTPSSQPFACPPSPLPTSSPSGKPIPTSSEPSESWLGDTADLVFPHRARDERSNELCSAEIHKRIDQGNANITPTLLYSPPQTSDLNSAYFLRSLSRSQQRARVGDPYRRMYLLPSEPAGFLRKKLKRQVIERRRLQHQEEAVNGCLRRAMGTLRPLMLKGDKQAQIEYFERREEEEHAKRQAAKVNIEQKRQS